MAPAPVPAPAIHPTWSLVMSWFVLDFLSLLLISATSFTCLLAPRYLPLPHKNIHTHTQHIIIIIMADQRPAP
ncbi:hypothetical protein FJTKL_08421 [Diaporthe vaccinii]|uniref:ATP synthase F0 subunit 8 n=1 Tax=Diaporthe vaccinii TaxID=105482 RepID=A0ABR4ERY9_9PEZI